MLLARATNGAPINIAFAAIDFELCCVERASTFNFGEDLRRLTSSAEDLIVVKVFANRERDRPDVDGVVTRRARDWVPTVQ